MWNKAVGRIVCLYVCKATTGDLYTLLVHVQDNKGWSLHSSSSVLSLYCFIGTVSILNRIDQNDLDCNFVYLYNKFREQQSPCQISNTECS